MASSSGQNTFPLTLKSKVTNEKDILNWLNIDYNYRSIIFW